MKVFSYQTTLAIGIRRNVGNIAACDLGSCILHDISHQSVCRFEVNLHAAIVGVSRNYQKDLNERRADAIAAANLGVLHVTIQSFRGDATNSRVWHPGCTPAPSNALASESACVCLALVSHVFGPTIGCDTDSSRPEGLIGRHPPTPTSLLSLKHVPIKFTFADDVFSTRDKV